MNLSESQKHAISEKLNRAIEAEHIMLVEASRHLGTPANYLSMIRNPTQWPRCPKSGWEAVYQWYNSGQKLSEFSVQHGAVSPRQAEELKPEVKKVLVEEMKEALRAEDEKPAGYNLILNTPLPDQQFTDTARLKVALDIEINLVVNGQKVQVR